MKYKFLLLILVVLVSIFRVDAYVDTVKKKSCPKKVYIPGSSSKKGNKFQKVSKRKKIKTH